MNAKLFTKCMLKKIIRKLNIAPKKKKKNCTITNMDMLFDTWMINLLK